MSALTNGQRWMDETYADAAVADAYGLRWKTKFTFGAQDRVWLLDQRRWFEPTRNMALGAALIAREVIQVGPLFVDGFWYGKWEAIIYERHKSKRVLARESGRTMLLAAMRCLASAHAIRSRRKPVKGTA